MKQVWKFKMPAPGVTDKHILPVGTEFLHVDLQDGDIMLWASVNLTVRGRELVVFKTVGTGDDVSPLAKHVGTVLIGKGALVWHVFELTRLPVEAAA